MENQTQEPSSSPSHPSHPFYPSIPSKVIARLTHFITAIYFGGLLSEFFSQGRIKPLSQMSMIYTSLLTAYAGEKEVRRWNGLIEDGVPNPVKGGRGEYIVTGWFLFFGFCWLWGTHKLGYQIPSELPTACLSALSIFVGSKVSKRFYQGKIKKVKTPLYLNQTDPSNLAQTLNSALTLNPLTEDPPGEETAPLNNHDRTEIILNYLKENGKITREKAAEILGVSQTTAWRLLKTLALADQGKIKWVGQWQNDPEGYYTLSE